MSLRPPLDVRGFHETPSVVADFLSRWAIRDASDIVLEPCAGKGALIRAARARLNALGTGTAQQIIAVEKDRRLAKLLSLSCPTKIVSRDFLSTSPLSLGKVDAVLANPPFVRVRCFSKRRQSELADKFPDVSRRASLWAHFLAHARQFLVDSGRLAFVLPAELLTTEYGSRVLLWATENFSSVDVVSLEWDVFEAAQVRTILLLCEGNGKAQNVHVLSVESSDRLQRLAQTFYRRSNGGRTISAAQHAIRRALPSGGERLFEVCAQLRFVPLTTVARIKIGFVTGCDSYFLLSGPEVEKWKLPACCLVPVLGGPKQWYGLKITINDWQSNSDAGVKAFLLRPCVLHQKAPVGTLHAYFKDGKVRRVHERFKCKQRDPWFAVSLPAVPTCFLTYMSYRIPRLIVNNAQLSAPNRLHYVYLDQSTETATVDRFAFCFPNPLTLATCEIAGRAYGGGVLKLEPSDCKNVLVPDPLDGRLAHIPATKLSNADDLMRLGEERRAEKLIASTIAEAFAISESDMAFARRLHSRLRARRLG